MLLFHLIGDKIRPFSNERGGRPNGTKGGKIEDVSGKKGSVL
jgi:hypothetical protein